MRRRDFLKLSSAAAAGVAPASLLGFAQGGGRNVIRRSVPLGNTGIEVSDIAFGGSRLSDPELVRQAFERGVTYFDTAESYRGGSSEQALGQALSAVRSQVIIASKTRARADEDRDEMMRALEGSLKRLRTDYVDIYYNHAVNDLARLQNDEWLEFTDRAKRDGKIRLRGVSGHGSRLVECINYSLEHNLADVILVAFNFSQDAGFEDQVRQFFHYVALQTGLEPVLDKAKSAGVGIAAMKILLGAKLNEIRPREPLQTTFAQAALKWALASSKIDVAVISMTELELIDEYLGASGATQVSAADIEVLAQYLQMHSSTQCRQGCGICAQSCPVQVEISDVLRARMYAVDYGDRQMAATTYSALEHDASSCIACRDQPCMAACPNGLPIASLTQKTAHLLA